MYTVTDDFFSKSSASLLAQLTAGVRQGVCWLATWATKRKDNLSMNNPGDSHGSFGGKKK